MQLKNPLCNFSCMMCLLQPWRRSSLSRDIEREKWEIKSEFSSRIRWGRRRRVGCLLRRHAIETSYLYRFGQNDMFVFKTLCKANSVKPMSAFRGILKLNSCKPSTCACINERQRRVLLCMICKKSPSKFLSSKLPRVSTANGVLILKYKKFLKISDSYLITPR